MQNRMISTELVEEDIKIENHLRPQMLSDYICLLYTSLNTQLLEAKVNM